jgi:hypothetical protein
MIIWNQESLALLGPTRSHPATRISEKDAWKQLTLKRRGISGWSQTYLNTKLEAAKDRFWGTPDQPDPELDSRILAAAEHAQDEVMSRWVLWMDAAFGAKYTVSAFLDAVKIDLSRSNSSLYATTEVTRALREALSRCSDSEYQSLLLQSEPFWGKKAQIDQILCMLFNEPSAPMQLIKEPYIAQNKPLPSWALWIVQDPSELKLFEADWVQTDALVMVLYRHGDAAIESLVELAKAATNKHINMLEYYLKALIFVEDPCVAEVMVLGLKNPVNIARVRGWIQRNPEAGLKALAESSEDAALALLKELARTEGERLKGLAPSLSSAAQARLKPILSKLSGPVTTASLDQLPPSLKLAPALPAWVHPTELPEVLLKDGKHVLPETAHKALLHQALTGTIGVRDALDLPSLSSMLMALVPMMLRSGEKEKKLLHAVGRYVDDATARQYMKTVEAWASSSGGFHNATAGLQGLAARGDSGLRLVHRMSLKAKSQGLRKRAAWALDEAASNRRLTRTELEDRLVPDFDLSADGSLTLDYGPRKFRAVFDENLKPVALDSTGKILKDLPKPNQSDDPEKAPEAEGRWKQLKKDVREVAGMQIARLEQAMVDERTWSKEPFENCFVRHPLMQHLARRLLWKTEQGSLFRVAEDGSLADGEDNVFELEASAKIQMVHPVHLSEHQKKQWNALFGDYKLIQPFLQLNRPVFTLTEEEKVSSELKRFAGLKAPGGRFLGMAGKPGWQKGPGEDNGFMRSIYRNLPGNLLLEIDFSHGVSITGGYGADEEQTIDKVCLRGKQELGRLSRQVASEVLRELIVLTEAK